MFPLGHLGAGLSRVSWPQAARHDSMSPLSPGCQDSTIETTIASIALRDGTPLPKLGLGTWRMGERVSSREREVESLRLGLDLGFTLVDTAEMYGDGEAERIVGEATAGRRDRVFIVSKVLPQNASRRGTIAACERSLRRLATDHIDLYLLHWRGDVPLRETVDAFETLRADGRIRAWGVSNFDRDDMEELTALPGGSHCAANQILYHLASRGAEWDLLPFCRRHGIATMAYSPLGQGKLLRSAALRAIAERHGVSPATTALAWLLTQPNVTAIPKAVDRDHVRDNLSAADWVLPADARIDLERAFPSPRGATPLEML